MKSKEEYLDALECITKEYYSTVRFPEETNKFNGYLRLFTGLVNEHFEQKECQKQIQETETNFEHYKDEIATVDFDFAIKDGEITSCEGCYCSECRFGDSDVTCYIKRMKWLFQEHKEKIRLTRFEYDLIKTFDRCKECCLLNEIECLKKLSEKGYFKGIDPFTKVHDIIDNCKVIK